MREVAFRAQVVEVAQYYGWLVWYDLATNAPRRCPRCGEEVDGPRNPPGWPDLVLAKGASVLFRELKAGRGRLTTHQADWRARLLAGGADWALWRPEEIDAIVARLAT